jgi:hypothetical protein
MPERLVERERERKYVSAMCSLKFLDPAPWQTRYNVLRFLSRWHSGFLGLSSAEKSTQSSLESQFDLGQNLPGFHGIDSA